MQLYCHYIDTKQCWFSLEPTDATQGTSPMVTQPSTDAGIIAAVVIVLILVSIIAVAAALLVIMYIKSHRRKQESDNKVQQPQNVVLDLETREKEREAESFIMDEYVVIDKPSQNGMKTEVDALYSNQLDETITDDTYSCLQHSQKIEASPQKMAEIGYDYPKLSDTHSQIDPVVQMHDTDPSPAQQKSMDVEMLYDVPDKPSPAHQKSTDVEMLYDVPDKPSPAHQKSTDVEMLYAVPDKKKKKMSNKAPAVPEQPMKSLILKRQVFIAMT